MPATTRSSIHQGISNAPSPSESASTSGKRKLEEASEPLSRLAKLPKLLENFKLNETHSYRDGNLLLQVDGERFMVHRSRLEAVSPWFHMLLCRYEGNSCDVYGGSSEVQQEYIDACLTTLETFNDIPLFHLDCAGHNHDVPSAAECTALMDSIYNGIDYAFEPPTMDQLVLLAKATIIYGASTYINYVDKYLKVVFPSNLVKLGASPSVHVAVQGISLARYTSRFDILATAFYDIARVPASAIEECIPAQDPKDAPANYVDNESAPVEQAKNVTVVLKANHAGLSLPLTKNAKRATFNNLGRDDLLRLNLLQKRLAASWDEVLQDILAIKHVEGCRAACPIEPKDFSHVLQKFSTIKATHLSDPILGIKALIDEDLLKVVCVPIHIKLTKALKERRTHIWKKIRNEWVH